MIMMKLLFRKQHRQLRYWDHTIRANRRQLGYQVLDLKANVLTSLTQPSGLLVCFGLGIAAGLKLHKRPASSHHDDQATSTQGAQGGNTIAWMHSAILLLHYLEKFSAHLPPVLIGGTRDSQREKSNRAEEV